MASRSWNGGKVGGPDHPRPGQDSPTMVFFILRQCARVTGSNLVPFSTLTLLGLDLVEIICLDSSHLFILA